MAHPKRIGEDPRRQRDSGDDAPREDEPGDPRKQVMRDDKPDEQSDKCRSPDHGRDDRSARSRGADGRLHLDPGRRLPSSSRRAAAPAGSGRRGLALIREVGRNDADAMRPVQFGQDLSPPDIVERDGWLTHAVLLMTSMVHPGSYHWWAVAGELFVKWVPRFRAG